MMKWGNWLIGACCALFTAVVVVPTGIYEAASKMMTGEHAADWVQAIGSIAAIVGAWVLGNRQFAHDRRLEVERLARTAEDDRRRIEKRDRDAIDAMMLASDITDNIQDQLKHATEKRPFDAVQARRWVLNAIRLLAYHAGRDRDWADLVLTLFSAQQCLPPVLMILDSYGGGEVAAAALTKALQTAQKSLESNVRELTADRPYEPVHRNFSPNYIDAWPSWT
jgi:hypothetical protein